MTGGMSIHRDAGQSGSASQAPVRANNIKVTASENKLTSSSSIKLDDVHVTRVADFVGGLGITTTTLANGRGVGLEVDAGEAGLVTTSTVTARAGHPIDVTSQTLNKVDIFTTGGTHPVWTYYKVDQSVRTGGKYTTSNCEEATTDTQATPPDVPFVVVGGLSYTTNTQACDPPEINVSGEGPASLADFYGTIDVAGTQQRYFRFSTSEGMIYGTGLTQSLYGRDWNARGGVLGSGGLDINSGNLTMDATNYIDVGNPSGESLGFRTAGSINAIYGLFSEDVHALDAVYGSGGVVVGFGRQKHNNLGWLWWCTEGDEGVPTTGIQESASFTSNRGLNFQNHGAWNQGSVSSAFWFDDAIRATGDIDTSATVNAGNDVRAADDIIATDLVQGADVAATDDLTVGDDAAITGDLAVTGASSMTGLRRTVVTKTGDYTATLNDWTFLCDTSIGSFTITLPPAATCNGIEYYFQYSGGADTATIDADGAETFTGIAVYPTTISGVTDLPLVSTGDWAHIVSTGTEWRVIYGNFNAM